LIIVEAATTIPARNPCHGLWDHLRKNLEIIFGWTGDILPHGIQQDGVRQLTSAHTNVFYHSTSYPDNDAITMMNLIYLAKITERIPIIPTFTPSWHIGSDTPGIDFGKIFDVSIFTEETGIELSEWKDVKDPESEELEDIGCWSVWQAVDKDSGKNKPRASDVPKRLHLGMHIIPAA
jgi:hypothetical protein